MASEFLSTDLWKAVPILGGAVLWVGRLQQRMTSNEKAIESLVAEKIGERVANIEGQLDLMGKSLGRIEQHLLNK